MKKKISLLNSLFICFLAKGDVAPGVLDKYLNTVFVNTGIASCESIGRAIEINVSTGSFSEIYALEKDQILANHSQFVIRKYIDYHKVKTLKKYLVYHANPVTELAKLISTINKPITFVLSSYFPDWTDPQKSNRILEELDQIKMHPIKRHTILVDYLYFGNISLEAIKSKLLEINSAYKFTLEKGGHIGKEENAILVAYP